MPYFDFNPLTGKFDLVNRSGAGAGSNTAGMSNLGNTSGTTGVVSGSAVQYLLAGGNNITLSQSLNGVSGTLTISAFNQSAESQSGGISNLGNSSGTSGIASGAQMRLLLAGGNNITLSQSVDGASATITVSGANAGPAGSNTLGMSNLGNTSGTTGVVSGSAIQYFLAGGNNVTLSQSLNGVSGTVTISAFNQSVESQSAGISNIGNTSGTSGIASGGQVRFLLAGGNNITLSQSVDGGTATVTISAFNQTVESQSVGMSNVGNTSGTTGIASGAQLKYILAGGNNITLSQSLDGASGTVTISAFNQSVESQSAGISNLGNTSGTSGIASGGQLRFLMAGGNNITLSQSVDGASATVTVSAFNQTVESQSAGISNLGNTSGTSGIASGGQVRFLLAGGNNVTLSQSVDGASATVTVSAFNQTVESQSAGISNLGNTSGTSGIASGGQLRFLLAGGNNITLSQSVNGASATVTVSAFNQTVESQSIGMSNVGNTSGDTGVASGAQVQFVLAGGNNITLSQSLNGASGTVTISGPNTVPSGGATLSWYENAFFEATKTVQVSGSTQYVFPFILPQAISASYLRMFASYDFTSSSFATTNGTWTTTFSQAHTMYAMIYTQNVGASSRSIASYASASGGLTWQVSASGTQTTRHTVSQNLTWDAQGGVSNSSTQVVSNASQTRVDVNTADLSNLRGDRWLDIPFASSLSAGNYWMGLFYSTASAGGKSNRWEVSTYCFSQQNLNFRNVGLASNSTDTPQFGLGSWTTNAINTTASIAFANVTSTASHIRPIIQFIRHA